jgi:DNA-binding transcriptional MerR regulator
VDRCGKGNSGLLTTARVNKSSIFRIHLGSFGVNCATLLVHMQVGFTPRQVTRLTGVPYSTLNLWAKKGLIRPSVSEGAGSGSERIYNFSDLIALKVAFELRKSGVTTRSLRRVIDFLRQNERMQAPLAQARLIVSGRDVVLVKNQRELVSTLAKPGQGCLSFVVDLPRTLGELTKVADSAGAFAVGVDRSSSTLKSSRKQPTRANVNRQRKHANS